MKNTVIWSLAMAAGALLWLQFGVRSETQDARTTGRDKHAVNDWFFRQRAWPQGRINHEAWREALEAAALMPRRRTKRGETPQWQMAGPHNIGGRITALAADPSGFDTFYAGSASGGIFKTTDAGTSWEPIFDGHMSLSVGALAMDPSDPQTLYAGTGEVNGGGGSLTYGGMGIFKTVDGGNSWASLGLTEAYFISRIAISSFDSQTLYLGAMGKLYGSNDERGVFRSTDGGTNWEQVLFISETTGCIDLAINPSQPNILYAAMWQRIRSATSRNYGGVECGLYRSSDGGDSWQELTNGLPNNSATVGRIGITLSPSNPSVLYAIYADNIGFFNGVYKTVDGGNSWTRSNDDDLSSIYSSFGWWFGNIRVAPDDPDEVYALGLPIYRSTNGGASWSNISSGMHVDQHDLWVHPGDDNFILAGNDGGVYLSQNGAASFTKLTDLPITQFYTCEMDYQFPERRYGGTQDNGTNRTLTGANDDWHSILGGDGFYVLVDPLDNRFVYAESQYGNLARSTNGGTFFSSALSGIDGSDRNNWNSPLAMDPTQTTTLYFGTHRLYKSNNRAVSWNPISGDLTDGLQGGNLVHGTITTIAVSRTDSEVIYVGTDDGHVWVTPDGGDHWNEIATGLPRRWITRVAVDPFDAATVYVCLSGYRQDDPLPHLFKSEDAGAQWSAIAAGLPEAPLNDIVVDPQISSTLFVAGDVGVFMRQEDQPWVLLGAGLPSVPVADLTFHQPTRTLLAGTFGRSMYTITIPPDCFTAEDVLTVLPQWGFDRDVVDLVAMINRPCR